MPEPPGPPGLVNRMPLRCAVSVALVRLIAMFRVGPEPGFAQSRGTVTVAHSGTGPPRSDEYQSHGLHPTGCCGRLEALADAMPGTMRPPNTTAAVAATSRRGTGSRNWKGNLINFLLCEEDRMR